MKIQGPKHTLAQPPPAHQSFPGITNVTEEGQGQREAALANGRWVGKYVKPGNARF